tara:strand:- start:583 stop:771 length:189 start_codon:yes stop_codon:yes gene_type:complete
MSRAKAKEYLVLSVKNLFVMRPFNKERDTAIKEFEVECSVLGFDRELIYWQARMSYKIDKSE